MSKEYWKPTEIAGYEVSSLGRVKSVSRIVSHKNRWRNPFNKRIIKERILASKIDNPGYVRVRFSINGVPSSPSVHRLVAQAFIPNPENKPQVNHKNGVKSDNRVENLEWVTSKENHRHSFDFLNRKAAVGENSGTSKLTDSDVLQIRAWWETGDVSQAALSEKWGVGLSCINKVVKRKTWRHVA